MLSDFSLESSGPLGMEFEISKGKQIGVSPAALSLAIASAKLNASLGCSVSRSSGNNLEAGASELLQEQGAQGANRRYTRLTMDSLPDLGDPDSLESCHSDVSD